MSNVIKTLTAKMNYCHYGTHKSGKSAFIERHKSGQFIVNHEPTLLKHTLLKFSTNKGCLHFLCIESAESILADGHVVVFDTSTRVSDDDLLEHVPSPRVLCGNKIDINIHRTDRWTHRLWRYAKKHNVHYYHISARSNYNFEKP